MRQATLASAGFERYGKTTRRAAFLAEMDQVVPWPMLCALIEPVYPKPGNGRPPIGLERMLRIYFLQHWFNLFPTTLVQPVRSRGGRGAPRIAVDAAVRRH
jgi:IS5 family transposase